MGKRKQDHINTWIDPKKETTSKKQLSKHIRPPVLLMFLTSSYIVEKPEQPSSNDLLPAACVVNLGQKSNKQSLNRTAKPAAHLVNSGLSCENTRKTTLIYTAFIYWKS